MQKATIKNKLIDKFFRLIMIFICFITLYPFIYCLAYSLSDSVLAMVKPVTFFPLGFTFRNYKIIFSKSIIFTSLLISIARTVIGTLYALTITSLAAYALSKRYLPFNRTISIFLIIPMYVSGGLLPFYVLIHDLNLFNNFLVYILPHGFWAFIF